MRYINWISNYAKDATFVSSESDVNFPIENLQNPYVPEVWKKTAASTTMEFNLGVPRKIDFIGFMNASFAPQVTTFPIRVRAGNSSVPDGSVFETFLDRATPFDIWKFLPRDQEYRYWNIHIPDAGASENYAGVAIIGKSKASALDFQEQWLFGTFVNNRKQWSDGEYLHSEMLTKQKALEVTFEGLDEDEADDLHEGVYVDSNGSDFPLFIEPRLIRPDQGYYMQVVDAPLPVRRTGQNVVRFVFREMTRGVVNP